MLGIGSLTNVEFEHGSLVNAGATASCQRTIIGSGGKVEKARVCCITVVSLNFSERSQDSQ